MIIRLATLAMGTRFEIVLGGERETFLRAVGDEVIEEIELWHRRLSAFSSDSVVAEVNRHAANRPVHVDDETLDLLLMCRDLWHESGGCFDITLGGLMKRWGFRKTVASVNSADAPYGMQHVDLDERARTVRFLEHGLELDLGGIGKGWALDQCAAILRERGVCCAFLHGGTSSAIAIGAPTDADAWKIVLADGDESLVISLRDEAFAVSAPHGRTTEHGGRSIGHVLDPRTGRPTEAATLAAVVCPSAAHADAWSTSLLALNERPHRMPHFWTTVLRTGFTQTGLAWRIEGARTARVVSSRETVSTTLFPHANTCVEAS